MLRSQQLVVIAAGTDEACRALLLRRPVQWHQCQKSQQHRLSPRLYGDISVTCLLKLCCGPTASIEELGAHAFEFHDGVNPHQSSLQKRMLR